MKKCFLLLTGVVCLFTACCGKKEASEDPSIPITIYGKVTDAITGAEIMNVTVSALGKDEADGVIGKTTTGARGSYELDIDAMSFSGTLRAEKEPYTATLVEVEKPEAWQKGEEYKADIQLTREMVVYKGVVTDSNGKKLSGASIEVRTGSGSDARKVGSATTDANGAYTVNAIYTADATNPKKNWTNTITASKGSYIPQSVSKTHTTSDIGKSYTINFELIEEIN